MAGIARSIELQQAEAVAVLAYKRRLIDYLERFIGDLVGRSGGIAARILALAPRVDPLLWQAARREAPAAQHCRQRTPQPGLQSPARRTTIRCCKPGCKCPRPRHCSSGCPGSARTRPRLCLRASIAFCSACRPTACRAPNWRQTHSATPMRWTVASLSPPWFWRSGGGWTCRPKPMTTATPSTAGTPGRALACSSTNSRGRRWR